MWLGTQPMPPVMRVVTIPPEILIESASGGIIAVNAEALNVHLRRATAADAEDVSRWRNQPTSLRFQASAPRNIEQIRELLAAQEKIEIGPEAEGKFYWIIEVDGEPAGQVQVAVDGGFRQQLMSTLGYTVAESMQGRGVATAAVRDAIRIAFGTLGLERIEAVAAVENVASRRVLEKTGFQFEGIRRGLLRIQGKRVDHACYGILVTDSWEH
jgi:RimJ/RimL family protein N-acetyltransferase